MWHRCPPEVLGTCDIASSCGCENHSRNVWLNPLTFGLPWAGSLTKLRKVLLVPYAALGQTTWNDYPSKFIWDPSRVSATTAFDLGLRHVLRRTGKAVHRNRPSFATKKLPLQGSRAQSLGGLICRRRNKMTIASQHRTEARRWTCDWDSVLHNYHRRPCWGGNNNFLANISPRQATHLVRTYYTTQ